MYHLCELQPARYIICEYVGKVEVVLVCVFVCVCLLPCIGAKPSLQLLQLGCRLERLKLQFVFLSYNAKRSIHPRMHLHIYESKPKLFWLMPVHRTCLQSLCQPETREAWKEGGTQATLTSASAANHSHLIILYKFDFKLDSQINTCTLHICPMPRHHWRAFISLLLGVFTLFFSPTFTQMLHSVLSVPGTLRLPNVP